MVNLNTLIDLLNNQSDRNQLRDKFNICLLMASSLSQLQLKTSLALHHLIMAKLAHTLNILKFLRPEVQQILTVSSKPILDSSQLKTHPQADL